MRSYTAALVLLTACVGFVNSMPTARRFKLTGCDVSNDVIPLPAGQTVLTVPTDAKPIHIGAGIGTQNYSCTAAGTYTSIGAVAKLFDASCVYNAITSAPSVTSAKTALGISPLHLGDHYFITNPVTGTGVSPKFDFTSASEQGNPEAFVVAAKKGGIPSPDGSQNIDWLELTGMAGQGTLAKYVFRIDTVRGQPPASCTPGSAPITVSYAALYWFFN